MDTLLTSSLKEHPLQREFYEPLSGEGWKAFHHDIELRGITQPIIVSSRDGFTVVDGHQRFYAARELGLETVPAVLRAFESELEEAQWMVGNNDRRRHEPADKIANRAGYFLRKFSDKSNRVVGKMAQVSYKTIERQRKKLEEVGEIPKHDRRQEASGRLQKVNKTTGTPVPVKTQPNVNEYLEPRHQTSYNPARWADKPKQEFESEPWNPTPEEEAEQGVAEFEGVALPTFKPSDTYRRAGAAIDVLTRLSSSDIRQLAREEPKDYPLPLLVRLQTLAELIGEAAEGQEDKSHEVKPGRPLN